MCRGDTPIMQSYIHFVVYIKKRGGGTNDAIVGDYREKGPEDVSCEGDSTLLGRKNHMGFIVSIRAPLL